MNSQGASDVSPEAMQARIQQARREAETLKDRIKRKKDELSDTSRTYSIGRHGSEHPMAVVTDSLITSCLASPGSTT
jgi:hypothetical protein